MIPPQNVSDHTYHREVERRRFRCVEIARRYFNASESSVDLVVLSCKRPKELSRLLDSLGETGQFKMMLPDPVFGTVRSLNLVYFTWEEIETSWFVDNGSGDEVRRVIQAAKASTFDFSHEIYHENNLGMGRAVNDVLCRTRASFVLFVEDDLFFTGQTGFVQACLDIFHQFPEVGIIKLKRKANWDTYPYRRIGPMQTTSTGVRFHPWLPSPRWSFRWGQRPWYPIGVQNVWSLGPVMFRWCSWAENGPIPSGQGRGQAIAAEEGYARTYNLKWIAARPVDFAPFSQPPTVESPGFGDRV